MTQKRKRLLIGGVAVATVAAGGLHLYLRVPFPACLRPFADETIFVNRRVDAGGGQVQSTTTYTVIEPAERLVFALRRAIGNGPQAGGPPWRQQAGDEWQIEAGKTVAGTGVCSETKPMLGEPDWSTVAFVTSRPMTAVEGFMASLGIPWVGWHYRSGLDSCYWRNEPAAERLGKAVQGAGR